MQTLTIQRVKDYVLAILGNNQVEVDLVDEDWTQIFNRTLFKYNKYRPKMIELPLNLIAGKQDYQLDPSKVGRGVFNVIPKRQIGDNYYAFFDSSYFPLNFGGYRIDTPQFLEWKMFHTAQKQIYGTLDDWDYYPDTNTLRVYPIPHSGDACSIATMHDRMFEEQILHTVEVADVKTYALQVKDSEGFPVKNILPGFCIKTSNEIFRDEKNGTLVSNKNGIGTVNYVTGAINLTFNVSPAVDETIVVELYEVRSSDYDWYLDYALALASIIVGYKRRRFGNIPGQQGAINLDTAISTDGTESLKALEARAGLWMLHLAIPRQQ